MGTIFIFLGIFLWLGATMGTFVFLTPTEKQYNERLKRSVKINLHRDAGPEFGISLMKITGIFWVLAGVIISIIGESFLQGTNGDIVLGIILLTPALIGSIITERRKKSQSK